jgi:transcriptional regulator with XRE-family HTH domain
MNSADPSCKLRAVARDTTVVAISAEIGDTRRSSSPSAAARDPADGHAAISRWRAAVTSQEVGRRIREARLAKGWTHEELARRMGANWRTVQRWQKGSLPRLPTLLRLADVLEVPQSYLVARDEPAVTMGDLQRRLEELTARVEALTAAVAALTPTQLTELPGGRSASASGG